MNFKKSDERSISNYYNAEAPDYAVKFINELDQKPFDRYILHRFSETLSIKSLVCEIGCGPGQVSRYLRNENITLTGLDISFSMLLESTKANRFKLAINGSYFHLPFRDTTIDGILAFYAIVHDETSKVGHLLDEIWRVLKSKGVFLFSFHAGNERITANKNDLILEYIFHDFETVSKIIKEYNFSVLEAVLRMPYENAEYPSRRAYFLLQKV